MDIHPAAAAFPMLNGHEFSELVDDIRQQGQRFPIVTYRKQVLDGRNRLRACEQLGIEPDIEEWDGKGSPAAFVISANLHRRHLKPSQRAAIAAELLPTFREEARENLSLAGKTAGKGRKKQGLSKVTKAINARAQAAAAVGVAPAYVSQAAAVKKADPELFEKVKGGEVTIAKAMRIIEPTVEEEVQRQPGMKWANLIADLWTLHNSIKKHGIKRLAAKWPAALKQENAKKLRRLGEGLVAFAEEIE